MSNGGFPARMAIMRWAWRMFRREWRRQVLVLSLLTLSVAVTVFGLGAAANTLPDGAATFGAADYVIVHPGDDPSLAADVAASRTAYPATEVINHLKVPVPGSATAVDVRDQVPGAALSGPMLALTGGRYPVTAGEIAVSARTARLFGLSIGGVWRSGNHSWTVVGLVENPNDLLDAFALVAPGQAAAGADRVTVLVKATQAEFQAASRPGTASVQSRGEARLAATTIVLILATVGLLFIGLLAAAGFTVLAQHRLRALGMLAAVGARHRHLRLVTLTNGLVVGATAAVIGGVLGAGAWVLLAPGLESTVQHRIERFHLPWASIAAALLLATVTAVLAAWWPARAVARVPVVAALSARPPQPRPAHRFALLGGVLLAGGLTAMCFAGQDKPISTVAGTVGIAVGALFLAPVATAGLTPLARACPVAARIALRDLARYRARSGAALAAIILATGIAAAVIIGAGAAQAAATAPPAGGNLPGNELIVWVGPERAEGPVPQLDGAQLTTAQGVAASIATAVHGSAPLAMNGVVSSRSPTMTGPSGVTGRVVCGYGIPHPNERGGATYHGREMLPLVLATPELLSHFGIAASSVEKSTDLLTAHTDLDRYDLLTGDRGAADLAPKVQAVALPAYTSEPVMLATDHLMRALDAKPSPLGWLIVTPKPLTPAQIDQAEASARAAGLTVESRPVKADLSRLRTGAVGIGGAVALGVLAMTVGLIRGEGARDLRTLTANGAGGRTRRMLTAATAVALAGLGAVLGTAGAYAALIAWYHRSLHDLSQVPVAHLTGLMVGLPLIAFVGGWLLAGREPAGMARTPLD
jgi:putative ABC transport system permease protein